MCEFKRQGMRWSVEAQTSDDGVVTVEVADPKHSVNIYGCFEAVIDIKGKCKGVAAKNRIGLDGDFKNVAAASSCEVLAADIASRLPTSSPSKRCAISAGTSIERPALQQHGNSEVQYSR